MSNIRFNLGPTNNQVSDHIFYDIHNNRRYELIQPIGYWDYNNNTTLYKATLLPPPNRLGLINPTGAVVNIKACNKLLEPQWYEFALEDVARSNRVRHANILPVLGSFDDATNDDIFFLVLPESQTINLRSLMFSLETFKDSGLPEDCIVIALRSALLGLAHIHSKGEIHRQITGSNIVVYKIPDTIMLTFAGSAHVRTDVTHRPDPIYVPDPNGASGSQSVEGFEFLPYRDILKWGRAPEVVEADQEKYKTFGDSEKSDIWLIGITALEFAYGDIRIFERRELLDIARCISVTRKMATTWDDLVQQTEEFKVESVKPPKGTRQKIEEATVNFLTSRLAKFVAITRETKKQMMGNMAIVKSSEGKEKEGEVKSSKGKEKVGEVHKEPFSERFVKLVAKCLNDDPDKRPSAKKLLKCKLLKRARTVRYLKEVVMDPSPLS
ncbi:hypothetical protein POM88_011013 [Heracleum sosnowskyi]|uniref:Protein kinase domain-containing protein n=1 Tax=Heracleum sosnowskyi TaxID=360622 RepID=A0AAD8ITR9_9APIA|nr:hypothetical protein POM88_011013 [Heracleum sosnowskyi]